MAEEGDVGFEEGMLLLPTHVLDEACDSKDYLRYERRHGHRPNCKLPAEPLLKQSKCSLKAYERARYPRNWASGGPGNSNGNGMQAIFLDSGQRSCGTGVFLPRRAGTCTDFQPTKKPACSPVLLPSRVVQALKLNVHQLGMQIQPEPHLNNKSKGVDRDSVSNNKMGKDGASKQCCVISQSRSSSPEIFLPKEWTY